jgi:uncharacterized protein YcfJ
MNTKLKAALGVAGLAVATQAFGQVTFYEREDFRGRSFTTDERIGNLERYGFNDRASSAVVRDGQWQVCEDARFNGRCTVLGPGEYPSLAVMGLSNEISSVRRMERISSYDSPRYGYDATPTYNTAPSYNATPAYDYQRRADERLFEAPVTSVRAVVGPPEQRCWVERQEVVSDNSGGNVGGALIGGVLGGILGHQIGSGRGNTAATIGGAVAGAAIGNNVNRGQGGSTVSNQDVQRCASVPGNARPDYWDVTYSFRGQEHRVQMAAPPGPTVTVNRDGEPRY